MSLIEGIYSNSSFLQWLYKKTIFGAFLQKIKRYWYHCKYNHDTKRERKEEMLRRNGYEDPRFQTLKNLKGICRKKVFYRVYRPQSNNCGPRKP